MTLALIIWIGYFLGALLMFRPIFRAIILNVKVDYHRVDGFDLTMGILCSSFASLVLWWAILPVGIIKRCVGGDIEDVARVIGGESRAMKLKRLEKEKRDREQHIRELERELEII